MIRKLGWPYKKIEESGIMLPVLSLNVKYIKPAYYDDELTIKTFVRKLPGVRIEFEYEVYNDNNELINKGDTTLVFVDMKTNKPTNAPADFIDEIKKYFEK
jgi:acyl-CoA thioester hydrolase